MSQNRTVKSICPYCATGCGLLVEVKDDAVSSVRGDPSHPANFGRLCAKGALLGEMLDTPDRLLHPQVRESLNEPFRRVTWKEALQFVANGFQKLIRDEGPDAVSFYGSGQLPTEDYYLLGKLAKGFIGTNNQDTNSRLCMTSASAAYALALGQDGPPPSYADIEKADCFLILGANIEACHPVLFQRIKARKREHPKDVKVIVIDPRRTPTADIADLHLAVRPGSDVALLNSILHEIVLEGLTDDSFIEDHTQGWQDLSAQLAPYAPERVARGCGVEAEDIRAAALLYGRSRAALSLWSMGANQSVAGVDKNLGLINLALATGNIGKPGAGPFSLTGQPNAMGGREAGGLSHTLPGHRLIANPKHRAEMEEFWGLSPETISAKPGLTAVELFDAIYNRKVQAVWIIATNPVASMPNSHHVREALERADLVVVQDAYHPTETTELAHVLLPAAQWSERGGTMTNAERRVNLLEQATPAPGESLPDWQILCKFADVMGFGCAFDYEDTEAIFDEFKQTTLGRDLDMTGMSYEKLRHSGGLQWPMPQGQLSGVVRLYSDHLFPTESGRAFFHAISYRSPAEYADADFPYVLTTGRVKDQWHTRTRTGKVQKLTNANPEPFLEINTDDARHLGIRNGKFVEMSSRRGKAKLKARVTDSIRQGTVFAPFHWSRLWDSESDINQLTFDAFDPRSKEPELKYCAIDLRAL